jgi:hypothetical protein
MEDNKNKR